MKLAYPFLLNAKPQARPYKLTDRDSMYLYVSVTGTKTWKFDYRLDGKACTFTLGRFYDLMQSIAKRKPLARDERKADGAPYIAIRLRQHLDAIFGRAIISGRADANPVKYKSQF
ncbi:Arm DNA-binding domain-containing protein [Paraburkholderia sp. HD33-4]|uniref:Arm DNA-binding domain-containing protein n=1 Tax=Paraburkholderia sp. HD33-4 TaxID=2883242 RepID=UPI001F16AEF4|nr:Arm DNA-binding domain-containing protein [Paraburkholderia sp. HD33-4]